MNMWKRTYGPYMVPPATFSGGSWLTAYYISSFGRHKNIIPRVIEYYKITLIEEL